MDLTPAEFERVVELIENPPPPTEALKDALLLASWPWNVHRSGWIPKAEVCPRLNTAEFLANAQKLAEEAGYQRVGGKRKLPEHARVIGVPTCSSRGGPKTTEKLYFSHWYKVVEYRL